MELGDSSSSSNLPAMKMATTGHQKKAVVVGCNYRGKQKITELHGAINDANRMHRMLTQRLGFDPKNIKLLSDDRQEVPTRANIIRHLTQMVREAKPGDVMVFFFSGHGTRIRKMAFPTWKVHPAIVPADLNPIASVDLRVIIEKVPKGATFTIVADSCSSGGLIDKEKEQLGPNRRRNVVLGLVDSSCSSEQPDHGRFIPLEAILDHHLDTDYTTSPQLLQVDDIPQQMIEIFGPDNVSALFWGPQRPPLGPEQGILLSACQFDEISFENVIGDEKPAAVSGYFTYAVEKALKESHGRITNKGLVLRARQIVNTLSRNEQHPCLYCSDKNVNALFLQGGKNK